MDDAIALLTNDHRKVERLFRDFPVTSGAAKQRIADALVRELSIHAAIEEQYLYPTLRKRVADGERLVERALKEHQSVKQRLARIEGLMPADGKLEGEVGSLMAAVREHVREEENDLFQRLHAELDGTALQDLGVSMSEAKKRAPTHPHPHAPNRPPANFAVGAVAAAVDRIRDSISGRGRQ